MKKIIDGKLYNTETARALGSWSGDDRGSFQWFEETLHQKKTGEFFLYGCGHADSPYAKSCSDGTMGPGEAIRPLSYNAARKWAERRLSADEYEAIFGEIAEDDSRVAVNLSLSAAAADRARRAAAERGRTLSAYIEGLISADQAHGEK